MTNMSIRRLQVYQESIGYRRTGGRRLRVSDMQAPSSPGATSPSLITEATQAFEISQHFHQHHFQDDSSYLFSEPGPESSPDKQQAQLEPPGSFLPSQQANTPGSESSPDKQQAQLEPPGSFLPSQQANTPQHRETRRAVACQRCRDLKVRCDVAEGQVNCKRCLQRNRTCEMIEPKKKRAKKTDKAEEKFSELENRIQRLTQELSDAKAEILNANGPSNLGSDSLSPSTTFTDTAAFPSYQAPIQYPDYARRPYALYNFRAPHAFEDQDTSSRKRMRLSYESHPPSTYQPPVPADVARYSVGQMDADPRMMTVATSTAPGPRQTGNSDPIPGCADVLKRYIPDAAEAYRIYYRFASSMAPQIPIMVFPEYIHPANIFVTKPTLFLAIVSIAAPLEIQAPLFSEVLRILGHLIIVNQETSLELIQALQVLIVWFWPTDGRDARCSQYCSIACTMAISLGMNIPSGKEEHWSLWSAKNPGESGEGARAFVGCFILSSMYVKKPHRLIFSFTRFVIIGEY